MTARTPEQIQPLFEEAFNAGDIDGLMTFYETYHDSPNSSFTVGNRSRFV